MPTVTVENYLKQLYLEQGHDPEQLVPMGRLATAMRVVPGTATSMVKALADSGLVFYEPRTGARLTPGGEQLALRVLRRHRLVELFLVKVLGLDWSEVHDEAEELEHSISDKVLERIDELLGHPQTDPHGDPIPTSKGKLALSAQTSLADCAVNTPVRIARVLDQEPSFLQFVNQCGLTPGRTVTVESRNPNAGAIVIRVEGRDTVTLGNSAAEKMLVEMKEEKPVAGSR